MRNPNPKLKLDGLASTFLLFHLYLLPSSIYCGEVAKEWVTLTKRNFSSQIRLHNHILLMVTVPWSGESRSLMTELAHAATYKLETLEDLRLMVIHRNDEKMLATILGATKETTLFFYNNAMPYRYQGRLRAQNIFSAVNHFESLQSEELPLKLLKTPEDLTAFFQSTDKAVLLLEFCGWTPRLLGKSKNNGSESAFHVGDMLDNGIISGSNHKGQADVTLRSIRDKNQKGLNNEELTCGIGNGLSGIPWFGGFTLANDSVFSKTDDARRGFGLSCTFEEFKRFELFFSNFTKLARELFLPPERQRFGLVSNRSLLSTLDVQDPDSWLVMLHFAGCAKCSKILKEGDDLRSAIDLKNLLVTELKGEVEYALPANRPSVILFVDRSSESPNTRRKSEVALETFRKLALDNELSDHIPAENSVTQRKFSSQTLQVTRGRITSKLSELSRRESSQSAQGRNFENEMSLMVINEGGNVVLDNIPADGKGRSIQEILAHLLQQKKEAKFSLLAKEAGFQLVSDDFEVKIGELLMQEQETGNYLKSSLEVANQNIVESGVNLENNNVLNDVSLTEVKPDEQTGATDFEPQVKEEKVSYSLKNIRVIPVDPDQDMMTEKRSLTHLEKLESIEAHHRGFKCLYFFADGGYQLLKSLTAGSKIPSLVIVDPISEQHYIYAEEEIFSFSSLQGFLDAFLNGSLIPYQQSESVIQSPRQATRPPFINMDFHEVDSIPRVTVHSFSEQVLGYNQSDTRKFSNSWKKDVLVLFSNSWCGFCQRMELVVREVYRASMGYMNMSKGVSKNKESTDTSDMLGDAAPVELPLVFLMDCTLNDCSSLLKSIGQREIYPLLLLFPAQRKTAVSYLGDMSVNSVIEFLIDHGSNSRHLYGVKGTLQTSTQKTGSGGAPVEDGFSFLTYKEESAAEYHEVLLKHNAPPRSIKIHHVRSPTSNDLNEAIPKVVVGSVLIATDNLLKAPPFDKSIILIVQTNQITGFLGLIINKHITWDSFEALDRGIEMVKAAPLSFGGPLVSPETPLVSLTKGVIQEGYSEVFPNVYFLDQASTALELEGFKLGQQSSNDFWFFWGYSSWGWHQLFAEISEGAWEVRDGSVAELNWPNFLTIDTSNSTESS